MIAELQTPVFWIDPALVPPICDVPWIGRAIIEPTGNVKFCCFASTHSMGNINTAPFEEIWNGENMQRVRRELAGHQFPVECQTNACPIYRHDKYNYIVRRLDEQRETNNTAEHIRRNLSGTLRMQAEKSVEIELELAHQHLSTCNADLIIGIRRPDGTQMFLPDFECYPMPFYPGLAFVGESPMRLPLVKIGAEHFREAGEYEVCVALFSSGSDLNFPSNCLWSETARFTV